MNCHLSNWAYDSRTFVNRPNKPILYPLRQQLNFIANHRHIYIYIGNIWKITRKIIMILNYCDLFAYFITQYDRNN